MRDSLRTLASRTVAVVGDIILDVYIGGEVERISPEAPVPVIRLLSERRVPGGAANVAANVAALGTSVRLIGIAGDDDDFHQLRRALASHANVDIGGVLKTRERPTTTKTRIVGQRQQIARIDREDARPISGQLETDMIGGIKAALAGCDAILISDYGKGVLTDRVLSATIAAARDLRIPVIVDPKRRDLSAYAGAAIVTPNRAELALATGLPTSSDEEIERAARAASAACGASILVTRSEKGMSFVPLAGDVVHLPTAAREVFDVSGAGDTVVAVLGAALAADLPIVEAMQLANQAAGIVVGRFGTAVVTLADLDAAMHALSGAEDVQDGRLLSRDALTAQREHWRQLGLTVGFTNGCFDLLHPGHVSLLAQAAAACDRLIVALNTDASVSRLKGPARPVQSEVARAEVMGALKGVAAVVLFGEDTPLALIEAVRPDVLVKGADYREDQVVGADIVKAGGGRVLLAGLTPGQSTSRLIARSLDGGGR